MTMSHASSFFQSESHALGRNGEHEASSDEEEDNLKNPRIEHMITLVGDVKNRTVFIVDDMIDKSGSWIAAAETVVKKGFAKKVYCIATHGVFGGDSLEQLQSCECIDSSMRPQELPSHHSGEWRRVSLDRIYSLCSKRETDSSWHSCRHQQLSHPRGQSEERHETSCSRLGLPVSRVYSTKSLRRVDFASLPTRPRVDCISTWTFCI